MSLDDELSKRIKYVVSMAQEIPFYKRKFKELNIDAQKIRTPQDLLRAYKKGLYTSGSDLPYVIYYSDNRTKEFLTSGTSGKPKKVSMNFDDEDRIVAQSTPLFRKAFDKSDKILNCFPEHPAISGHMANCALSALGYNFIHAPAQKIKDDANKFLEFYNKIKATAFMSLTTFAYMLPVILEMIGIDSRFFIVVGQPKSFPTILSAPEAPPMLSSSEPSGLALSTISGRALLKPSSAVSSETPS